MKHTPYGRLPTHQLGDRSVRVMSSDPYVALPTQRRLEDRAARAPGRTWQVLAVKVGMLKEFNGFRLS